MPCRDEWASEQEIRADYKELRLVQAGLCAVLSYLDSHQMAFPIMLQSINWKEAGISEKEFVGWWEAHKVEDRMRREREAAEDRKKKLRQSALDKLTPEEKKVLGLK
jgi:hypothetical protein